MISKKDNKQRFVFRLYFLSGFAFALALLKYFFIPMEVSAYYFFLELIALIFFLVVIYLSDKQYRLMSKFSIKLHDEYEKEKNLWLEEEKYLKSLIVEYEEKETEAQRFASYQDRIIKKLVNTGKGDSKHHFLHLLSEVFQAGAIVLYKETEPSGQFAVEETYALPDGVEPAPFAAGEGLNGQAVADGKAMAIEEVPEEILTVASGIGSAKGRFLYLLPVMKEERCQYLIEMVTFRATDAEKMWENISTIIVEKGIL
jgi:hypothetical protein